MRHRLAWVLALAMAGPATFAQTQNPAPAPAPDTVRRMLDESRKVAEQLVQQIGGELRRELELTGPLRGLIVCKFGAPEMASAMSRKTGWRVSRVSLQTRNPALGSPDPWEYRVLTEFDQRVARGEKADGLEFGEVVREPSGNYFRYMKALPVARVCLNCHGPVESLSPEVRERLAADYPYDRGTGYSIGQVRGAVTVKRPL
jgi:hypothetical protein